MPGKKTKDRSPLNKLLLLHNLRCYHNYIKLRTSFETNILSSCLFSKNHYRTPSKSNMSDKRVTYIEHRWGNIFVAAQPECVKLLRTVFEILEVLRLKHKIIFTFFGIYFEMVLPREQFYSRGFIWNSWEIQLWVSYSREFRRGKEMARHWKVKMG